MKRLRSLRVRSYLLPVLLAALACRALLPADFMASGTADTPFRVTMCSLEKGQLELIELPGRQHDRPSCEHCLAPLLGAPLAFLSIDAYALPPLLVAAPVESQVIQAPIARAQLPRAPPHA